MYSASGEGDEAVAYVREISSCREYAAWGNAVDVAEAPSYSMGMQPRAAHSLSSAGFQGC